VEGRVVVDFRLRGLWWKRKKIRTLMCGVFLGGDGIFDSFVFSSGVERQKWGGIQR